MTRWTGVLAMAALTATAVCGTARAGEYASRKAFVKAHIPEGSTMKMRTVVPGAKDRKALAVEYGIQEFEDTLSYILGRDGSGKITAAIVFVERVLEQYDEWHHVAVALDPAGVVKEVAMLSVTGEYARMVDSKSFLGQFARKKPKKAGYALGAEINAVTGATLSSGVVADVVNLVMGVYRKLVNPSG